VLHVIIRRAGCDHEPLGDLAVGQAVRDKHGHLTLAGGERPA